ncbi:MAG: hypothetical protein AAGF75_13540, partial [Cyanobacteria bacterium P01_H01_bin.130]
MSSTPTPTPPNAPKTRLAAPPAPPKKKGNWLWGLTWRLGVLGLLSSGSAVLGMFVAIYLPGPGDRPPLVEQLRSGAEKQLGQWWDAGWETLGPWLPGNTGNTTPTSETTPLASEAAPANPSANADAAPLNGGAAPPQLSAEKRQALQRQLNGLQIQMNDLIGQTTQLETQLGERYPGDPIEVRLRRLGRQIDPDAIASSPIAPSGRSPQVPSTITLPSDSLFADGQSVLRPEAITILDNIIPELQLKPDAHIQVFAHT